MVEQAFGQAIEPVLDRQGVEDDLAIVSHAHGGHHVLHRILELGPGLQRGREFRGVQHGRQHRCNIAVAAFEGLGHARHQRGRRGIADETGRKLLRDVGGGRRLVAQDIERLVDFRQRAPFDHVTEESLVAVVVPRRIEFERALAIQLGLQLGLQLRILGF